MPPRYPALNRTACQLTWAAIRGTTRSFRQDAQRSLAGLRPPLRIHAHQNIPASGPCLLVCNHYNRSGFQAWWIPLAIQSAVPAEIHWSMTAAWTFVDPDGHKHPVRAGWLTPLTRQLFRKIAGVYGFTPMPPMPPNPAEVFERARAVRRELNYARRTPNPLIGLAPEGRDAPGGILQWPSEGVGRFILLLLAYCQAIIPVGLFEEGDELCLRFGVLSQLELPSGLSHTERDREASRQVMTAIAQLLPTPLRGEFG